ncbi:MAG: ROK family protein [Candidatus Fervidibacter sp.]|uniref:ROK family protein n=1 Tax=Candidatus Fervidibacter sp. TaxID=3100871 RepID=UPI00404B62CD
MRFALAIDLGGTKVAAAVVSEKGTITSHSTRPTEAQKGGDWVLNRIKEAALEALEKSKIHPSQLLGVGMGTPGVVDTERGIMLSEAVNIPEWKGRNLKEELERILGVTVFVENDANAAGLGELVFGAGKGAKSLVFVALGTGIGGAVILNGELVHGSSFAAGELGHISIDPNGLRCGCGNYGCIELYASGPAIAQRAREYVLKGAKTKLSTMVAPEELTAEHVARAAQEGDLLAQLVLAEAGKLLGVALAGVVNLLNPNCIVIGGGVAQAGDWILEPVRWEVKRRALPDATKNLKILQAALGTNAGVLGAAALVFRSANK